MVKFWDFLWLPVDYLAIMLDLAFFLGGGGGSDDPLATGLQTNKQTKTQTNQSYQNITSFAKKVNILRM